MCLIHTYISYHNKWLRLVELSKGTYFKDENATLVHKYGQNNIWYELQIYGILNIYYYLHLDVGDYEKNGIFFLLISLTDFTCWSIKNKKIKKKWIKLRLRFNLTYWFCLPRHQKLEIKLRVCRTNTCARYKKGIALQGRWLLTFQRIMSNLIRL